MIDPNEEKISEELKQKPITDKKKGVVVVAFIIVAGIIGVRFFHKKPAKAPTPAPAVAENSSQLNELNRKLQDALAKLKKAQDSINDVPPISAAVKPKTNDELEKERKLRMNADTEIGVSLSPDAKKAETIASNTTSGLVSSDGNSQFANSQATSVDIVKASNIAHPDSTIVQGDFLHAVLTVAISSELPGMVEASLTRPVYSYTGKHLLLPTGSRLVGQFAAGGGTPATERLFIVWNRVITPKGVSVMINSPSSDQIGRSGQGADVVDSHFWTIFGTGALLSIIGVGSIATSNSTAQYPSIQDQYKLAITNSFGDTAGKVMGSRLSIAPTLYINQGTEINVFVAHDLDFFGLANNG